MASHPLVPLSAEEFRATAAILRRDSGVTESFRFASIELKEPAKSAVRVWTEGDPVPRTSFAVLWNRADNKAYEATVDLDGDAVASFVHVPDVCPNFTVDEFHEIGHALAEHPDVIAALAGRGITDVDSVLFDTWTYGKALMPEQWRDRRLGWVDVWFRATPDGNPYAHPVSGLKFIVDMNSHELLEIEDHHDVGTPDVSGEYIPGVWKGELRADLKPLEITQPEGISFTVTEDGLLKWQNWTMRLGFNYREGTGAVSGRLRRPRHPTRDRLPDVVRRDGSSPTAIRRSKLPHDLPVDVKTPEDGGTYDRHAPDAPVTIYADGMRVAFDLCWHSSGKLFAAVNGSSPGGNTPAGPGVHNVWQVVDAEHDWLFDVQRGGYYGHPNPEQGHYVFERRQPDGGAGFRRGDAIPGRHAARPEMAPGGLRFRHTRLAQRHVRIPRRRGVGPRARRLPVQHRQRLGGDPNRARRHGRRRHQRRAGVGRFAEPSGRVPGPEVGQSVRQRIRQTRGDAAATEVIRRGDT